MWDKVVWDARECWLWRQKRQMKIMCCVTSNPRTKHTSAFHEILNFQIESSHDIAFDCNIFRECWQSCHNQRQLEQTLNFDSLSYPTDATYVSSCDRWTTKSWFAPVASSNSTCTKGRQMWCSPREIEQTIEWRLDTQVCSHSLWLLRHFHEGSANVLQSGNSADP